MAFQVIWTPQAESQLIKLWLDSRSRQRMREASDELEQSLKLQPKTIGESRAENIRIVFQDLIGCRFRVMENANTVMVEAIWQCH